MQSKPLVRKYAVFQNHTVQNYIRVLQPPGHKGGWGYKVLPAAAGLPE